MKLILTSVLISEFLDIRGATKNSILIAHRTGLYNFNGSYSEENNLAWKIQDTWDDITALQFHKVQVLVDTTRRVIFVVIPKGVGATVTTNILTCDYKQGLTPKAVRWSLWTTHVEPTTVYVRLATSEVVLIAMGTNDGNDGLYQLSYTARGDTQPNTNIDAYARFGQVTFNQEGAVNHYIALRVRARGAGTLELNTWDLDDANTTNPTGLTLATAGGVEQERRINLESTELSVRVRTQGSATSWFKLFYLRIAGKARWSNRPG